MTAWSKFKGLFVQDAEAEKRDSGSSNFVNPKNWLMSAFGFATKSKVTVTPENILQIPAVYAANKIISESIASLPLEVFKKKKNGVEKLSDHPISNLINKNPSELYTSFTLRQVLQTSINLHGNGYLRIIRGRHNRPTEFRFHEAKTVTPFFDKILDRLFYKIEDYSSVFTPDDIVHLKGFSTNGLFGVNIAALQKEVFGSAMAARDFAASYFGNEARPAGVLTHPGVLSAAGAERLRGSFAQRHAGSANAGKTIVLEEGMKFEAISSNPRDSDLSGTQNFILEDIARVFNMPVHMLQHLGKMSFNNIEQMSAGFVQYTLRPWVKMWEQELNRKLFTEKEQKDHFVRFNMDALMRGSLADRAEYYSKAIAGRWLSPNDVRELEKLNRVEGLDKYENPNTISKLTQKQKRKKTDNGKKQGAAA